MAYGYNALIAEAFRPYSEKPTNGTGWANLINNFVSTAQVSPIINTSGYEIQAGSDGSISESNVSVKKGYLCFGADADNKSFEIFFVMTCPSTWGGCGPHIFSLNTGSSKTAEYGGYSKSAGQYFGVWRVGSVTSSNRTTAFKLSNFIAVPNFTGMDKNGTNFDDLSPTDDISVSTDIKTYINSGSWTEQGALFPGCVQITTSFTFDDNITMGKSNVQASITAEDYSLMLGFNMKLDVLDTANLASGTGISYNSVLPYTLESYFNDAQLRRQTKLHLTITNTATSDGNIPAPILFINNIWQPHSHTFVYDSAEFTLSIDKTRLPTFTSIAGQKISKHKSDYVMLMDGNDMVNFQAKVNDQSYAYANDYNNYTPTFALYIGDVLIKNYRPTSVSHSTNTVTTYNGSYGPITVNPPVALGVNQSFRAIYQDRFGRQAETTIPLTYNSTSISYLRFYNYTSPTWTLTGTRVNSSGTPDDRNGTYVRLDYSWSLSLLDYSLSPHGGTARPVIRITNNQDSQTRNYTITTNTGSNSVTLSSIPIDKSYTFMATLTDAAGRVFNLSCFVASGEVFMDFKAGGSGLGIGKRAEYADKLSIGWDTDIAQDLKVNGNISGPTITDIYNKIASVNTGGGGGGGTSEPVTGTADTVLTKITDSTIYLTNNIDWRGIAIPFGSQYTSGGDAFMILIGTGNKLTFSSNPTTYNLPYTFRYASNTASGMAPIVLVNNHAYGGAGQSTSFYAKIINASQISFYPYSTGKQQDFDIVIMGVVDDYFTSNPFIVNTSLNLSGGGGSGGGGGVTLAQVESAITAALADYPSTNEVSSMINNALSNTVTRETVNQMIASATIQATKVSYNNSKSKLAATTAQAAIDEVNGKFSGKLDSTAIANYYTKLEVDNKIPTDFYTRKQVDDKIAAIPAPDLSNYYTKSQVDSKIASIPETDLTNYYTKSQVDNKIAAIPEPDLSPYSTTTEVQKMIDDAISTIVNVNEVKF